jgi:hypothetical protein
MLIDAGVSDAIMSSSILFGTQSLGRQEGISYGNTLHFT